MDEIRGEMSGEGVNGIKKKTLNFSIVLPLSSVNEDWPPSVPTENYVTPPPPILHPPLRKIRLVPFSMVYQMIRSDNLRGLQYFSKPRKGEEKYEQNVG